MNKTAPQEKKQTNNKSKTKSCLAECWQCSCVEMSGTEGAIWTRSTEPRSDRREFLSTGPGK